MIERPILFNGSMVRAILSGQKTATRRVAKPVKHPDLGNIYTPGALVLENEPKHVIDRACPYGQPGDRLWVRESFADLRGTGIEHRPDPAGPLQRYAFAADSPPGSASDEARKDFGVKWKPSIHMPRIACRLLLEITAVRVERLQDITRGDAMAEGCPFPNLNGDAIGRTDPVGWFSALWESINSAESWAANPWVWVVEFKQVAP
jgi:hypothetical protein